MVPSPMGQGGSGGKTRRSSSEQADIGLVGLGVMGAEPRAEHRRATGSGRRLQPHDREIDAFLAAPAKGARWSARRSARRSSSRRSAAAPDHAHGQGRPPVDADDRTLARRCSSRATSSSTAATRSHRHRAPRTRARRHGHRASSAWASRAARRARATAPRSCPAAARGLARRRADPRGSPRRSDGDALLRTGSARRRRPLRQDGPQRHRVRRHAADRRGLRPAAATGSASTPPDGRRLRRVERGALDSFLIEITADIFAPAIPTPAAPLVDVILDKAGQKGTGKLDGRGRRWSSGVPVPTITEAVVAARSLVGAQGRARRRRGQVLRGPSRRRRASEPSRRRCATRSTPPRSSPTRRASRCWPRPRPRSTAGTSTSARSPTIWRGGCIIRARFLDDISAALRREPEARQPAARSVFTATLTATPGRLAAVVAAAAVQRRPGAGLRLGAGLLRHLPLGAAAREPDPGPARLLRRPHLRARRPRGRFHTDWAAL